MCLWLRLQLCVRINLCVCVYLSYKSQLHCKTKLNHLSWDVFLKKSPETTHNFKVSVIAFLSFLYLFFSICFSQFLYFPQESSFFLTASFFP